MYSAHAGRINRLSIDCLLQALCDWLTAVEVRTRFKKRNGDIAQLRLVAKNIRPPSHLQQKPSSEKQVMLRRHSTIDLEGPHIILISVDPNVLQVRPL
jgi:hypothetical protein